MSKTLVITEKPSVAREYAKILSVNSGRNDGFIGNNNYIITQSYCKNWDNPGEVLSINYLGQVSTCSIIITMIFMNPLLLSKSYTLKTEGKSGRNENRMKMVVSRWCDHM